jgi:processive 1,2-diacylglycerol beta-glucosyltransferase
LGRITLHASYFICFCYFFQQGWRVIWVLTAGFGDGHNSAARSVAEALGRVAPGEQVVISDFLKEVHPLICTLLQSAYRLVITRFPTLWHIVYRWFASPSLGDSARWLPTVIAALDARIETEQPRIIISTYPFYSSLLNVLRQRGASLPPILTIITDSITVHSSWTCAPSDAFCVADQETATSVQALGVRPEQLHITGFPVSLRFLEMHERTNTGPSVLYMPSTTAAHFGATLEALLPLMQRGVRFTVQTGRNAPSYYHTLRRFLDKHPQLPLHVLGWTDQIPRLLQTHDVLVCKAGGAILHEALAAQIPVVIDYVVPGQEEGNAELLTSHQCAVRSLSAQETADQLDRLLDNHLALATSMRINMQSLSVPQAALRIAELAITLAR